MAGSEKLVAVVWEEFVCAKAGQQERVRTAATNSPHTTGRIDIKLCLLDLEMFIRRIKENENGIEQAPPSAAYYTLY